MDDVDWNGLKRWTEHRQWPLPDKPWVGQMSWLNLLFVHWPVDPEQIKAHLPAGLSLVPLEMRNVSARGFPLSMQVSELNLRTYVSIDGDKPGLWFFSLEASRWLAVAGARAGLHLPYFKADIDIRRDGEGTYFKSRRTHPREPHVEIAVRYEPTAAPVAPQPGSLDDFLLTRLCLYSTYGDDILYRQQIHHPPWPASPVDYRIDKNEIHHPLGLNLNADAACAHHGTRVDVLVWLPERI